MLRTWHCVGVRHLSAVNRRVFVGTGATLAAGVGVFGYTTIIEPHWLEIVRRDLPIAKLPVSLDGATLAHVSDLHACSYVDESYLTESLDRIKPFAPDIVAFTGDFVSWEEHRPERAKIDQLQRILSHLPAGRLATLGVLGNHDYGNTWRDRSIALLIASTVSETGMRVLRNEVATVDGLDIVGVDDLWSGRADAAAALAMRSSESAIALCHNPDAMDDVPWGNYAGWILAGHTHGGQCKPPFLPPPVLPVKNRRYTSGEIQVDPNRRLYISRGVGHLLKARFNVRPEITVFTLRTA